MSGRVGLEGVVGQECGRSTRKWFRLAGGLWRAAVNLKHPTHGRGFCGFVFVAGLVVMWVAAPTVSVPVASEIRLFVKSFDVWVF